ncbi:GNAT family N-acetyltransferase [Salinigranum rubrum]|uniref:GNAT family N-acetyltransferase n=1 Tax=Salinigranum rubrum TaxID=755307 RepID=A0A2I8VN70_9EURY|nr:GNAT family N-acetyltransferase [Salinigranum rubrum]AUV83335.1 GNAT family N-acetyltransferase [Salinigranum rubrum]
MTRELDVDVAYEVPDGCLDDVVRLLRSTGWAADRDADGVRRMLDHTDVVVCLVREVVSGRTRDTEVVGFARALTDYEYRAFVEDVVVGVPYRGRGLGSKLVEELCAHPELVDVERLVLECRLDLVDFYERFGFQRVPSEAVLLKRERD